MDFTQDGVWILHRIEYGFYTGWSVDFTQDGV